MLTIVGLVWIEVISLVIFIRYVVLELFVYFTTCFRLFFVFVFLIIFLVIYLFFVSDGRKDSFEICLCGF